MSMNVHDRKYERDWVIMKGRLQKEHTLYKCIEGNRLMLLIVSTGVLIPTIRLDNVRSPS